jgi:hypothetical protein
MDVLSSSGQKRTAFNSSKSTHDKRYFGLTLTKTVVTTKCLFIRIQKGDADK